MPATLLTAPGRFRCRGGDRSAGAGLGERGRGGGSRRWSLNCEGCEGLLVVTFLARGMDASEAAVMVLVLGSAAGEFERRRFGAGPSEAAVSAFCSAAAGESERRRFCPDDSSCFCGACKGVVVIGEAMSARQSRCKCYAPV